MEKDATARLRRAVKENNLFLVKRLIQRTDMRNSDPGPRRYTSLAWAAVLGHEETFEFLLQNAHDDYEYSRDSENNYILMLLADQKPTVENADVMRAALRMTRLYYDRYPKTLNWQNIHGKTALHFASQKGNEELVRMLCDLGADYDLPDYKGNTPLHYASSWGHIGVVQLLVERGCQYTAKNNENFTALDYAYSANTRETLEDIVRLQYENKKHSRRAIFAQAASKGGERSETPPLNVTPIPIRDRDMLQSSSRMRSGSGTSRTTNTSDSGDLEGTSLAVGHHSSHSASLSSSPSQPSVNSMSIFPSSQFNPTNSFSQHQGSVTSHSASVSSSYHASSALSSLASRVRERDADAMEKYLRRNRSESQGTSSTENRSMNGTYAPAAASTHTGASTTAGDADELSALAQVSKTATNTFRRLRPSISATQLRARPSSPIRVHHPTNSEVHRHRSGTNPTSPRPIAAPIISPVLTRSSSITAASMNGMSPPASADSETYTGPPSQYAQFPEPPSSGDREDNSGTTPIAARRMAFHGLAKYPLLDPLSASNASHRRGLSAMSAVSVRGGPS